jgi:hypothetical protein
MLSKISAVPESTGSISPLASMDWSLRRLSKRFNIFAVAPVSLRHLQVGCCRRILRLSNFFSA